LDDHNDPKEAVLADLYFIRGPGVAELHAGEPDDPDGDPTEQSLVQRARRADATWQQIADSLGRSMQSVWKRYHNAAY
jgi:hypothetical protein